MTHSSIGPPFHLGQTVFVQLDGCEYIGRITAIEPGGGLREPIDGLAYHVRLSGLNGSTGRLVVVGRDLLETLGEG